MSIYGETFQRFRTGPSSVALSLTNASLILIGAPLATVALSAADLLLANFTVLFGPMFLYAPVAASFRIPRLTGAPPAALYDLSTPLIATAAILLAFLLVWFWPTEQRLATRLFVHSFALNLLLWGCLAPSFAPDAFRGAERATAFPSIVWMAVALLIGAWVSMLIQRKSVELLMNFSDMEAPGRRLLRWALMLPLPMGALGAAAWLNGYPAGTWGCLALLGATMLETLSRRPKPRHEEVGSVLLHEAAVTLPIVAAAIIATSAWGFGFPAAGLGPHVLVWKESRLSRPSLRQFQAEIRFVTKIEEILGDKANPEIKIRWSKDRGKKRDVTLPQK